MYCYMKGLFKSRSLTAEACCFSSLPLSVSLCAQSESVIIKLTTWKNGKQGLDLASRFSSLLRDKPLRSSWDKKMEAKREKELVKKYAQQLKEEKAREKEEKRKRREESLRRREENERKAEIVQVIRNPAKMKRMKKKQLRRIEKRDTLALQQKAAPRNQSGPRKAAERSQ